jgi:secondary thiamine-phosphate synthase enzyme
MQEAILVMEMERKSLPVMHYRLELQTSEPLQFVDLTERIAELVRLSGVQAGMVGVQTRHTTTGIVINEHEPLLLDDMKRLLERLVPEDDPYQHDDFDIRTVNLTPDERRNGYAHCRALFLRASETVNVASGQLQLGRWQRIFMLELDGPRQREISVMILGERDR